MPISDQEFPALGAGAEEEERKMLSREELRLLCDTFRRSHVQVSVMAQSEFAQAPLPHEAEIGFFSYSESLARRMEPRTVYRTEDSLALCHTVLCLGGGEVLVIGPYLARALTPEECLELWERAGIAPQDQRGLREYYSTLAVLSPNDRLFSMLESFCESLWETSVFSTVELDSGAASPPSFLRGEGAGSFDEHLMSMRTMESRYAFENELMRAVSTGQIRKAEVLSAFSVESFEKRSADPLRNLQNYDIIMNTLLRKAAEQGGVHPVYLDRVSSSFAKRIEQLADAAENLALMQEMFLAYCRLVRKHAIRKYSPPVQKTVLLIDADLSAELSPSALARALGLSLGYLSKRFREETGETISGYVRTERMKLAKHLLQTTQLQIQTVAQHCGIMDVQYFAKIFKRESGMTPREYREAVREGDR